MNQKGFINEDDYSDIVAPPRDQGKIDESIDDIDEIDYNFFLPYLATDITNNENSIKKQVDDIKNQSNLPNNNEIKIPIESIDNSISVNIAPSNEEHNNFETPKIIDNREESDDEKENSSEIIETPKVIDNREESDDKEEKSSDKVIFERGDDTEIKNESRLKGLWNGIIDVPKNLWNFLHDSTVIEKSEKISREIGNISPVLFGLALIFADVLKNEIELRKKILEELQKLQAEDAKKQSGGKKTISTEKIGEDDKREIIVERDENMLNSKQDSDTETPDVDQSIKDKLENINPLHKTQYHAERLNKSRDNNIQHR